MKLLCLLPVATLAFAPVRVPTRVVPTMPGHSSLVMRNELDDFCENVTDKTEEVADKVDNLVLKRVMRVVDHAPMIYTLRCLANKGGISAKMWSVSSNPAAFTGLKTALPIPTWCFNIWTVLVVLQGVSIAKSALADDKNDLSQADITASAAANWAAARTVGSTCCLCDTILTSVVSGYALRNCGLSGDVTIHKASMQMMSSFTTVLAVLGTVSAVAAKIPVVNECSNAASILGIAAYYIMATRAKNGTVRKAVNAGIIGGVLCARLSGGLGLTASVSSIVPAITLAGTVYVAYESINRLRKALFD